ncbi:hypothetical protein LZ32DRAFT_612169 [Colletotrichum eremochloae]|nr:hypothetical protein LZ32DRAFT_612169 [Colletotrichum eremochloae]
MCFLQLWLGRRVSVTFHKRQDEQRNRLHATRSSMLIAGQKVERDAKLKPSSSGLFPL